MWERNWICDAGKGGVLAGRSWWSEGKLIEYAWFADTFWAFRSKVEKSAIYVGEKVCVDPVIEFCSFSSELRTAPSSSRSFGLALDIKLSRCAAASESLIVVVANNPGQARGSQKQ